MEVDAASHRLVRVDVLEEATGPVFERRIERAAEEREQMGHALHQLLHAHGDARAGPRSRFRDVQHVSAAALALR